MLLMYVSLFARSICDSGETGILEHVQSLLKKLAKAYLGTFEKARQRREFFGLRDFYRQVPQQKIQPWGFEGNKISMN